MMRYGNIHILARKKPAMAAGIIFLLLIAVNGPALAADETTVKLQKEEKAEMSTVDRIKPEFGMKGFYIFPFGTTSNYLGNGYGGALYLDLAPYWKDNFRFRLGITSGFMFFKKYTSTVSSRVVNFPEYVHMKFAGEFSNGVRLALVVGGGMSIVLQNKTERGLTGLIGQQYLQVNKKKLKLFEPVAVAGVELGYAPPSVRHLYIFLEYNYMMLFGGFDGQLLSASIGIANKY